MLLVKQENRRIVLPYQGLRECVHIGPTVDDLYIVIRIHRANNRRSVPFVKEYLAWDALILINQLDNIRYFASVADDQ